MRRNKMLDIKMETEKLLQMYNDDPRNGTFNAILLGQIGVGKTTMIKTARKPILFDSFDPGGIKLNDYKEPIKQGKIIPDTRWENRNRFKDWEDEFERRRDADMFSKMGTYVIDSATMFLRSMSDYAMYKSKRDNVSQPEWGAIGHAFIKYCQWCTALPCDFIMTGHLVLELDPSEGHTIARFNSIPSLQINVPMLYDEIYVLVAEEGSEGLKRSLLTQSDGKYIARTRIGSGLFLPREDKLDFKYLLEKAGLPTEDKV
jgi:hypothetical protein